MGVKTCTIQCSGSNRIYISQLVKDREIDQGKDMVGRDKP